MTMYQKLPSLERLNALFEEKEPGILYYRGRGALKLPPRSVAGNVNNGYCTIIISGFKYLRHRLIWKMHTGQDPVGMIDHINGVPGNDFFENLRDITASENARNGRHFVDLKLNDTPEGLIYAVRFHFDLWADEDGKALQQELERLLTPSIEKIISNRIGRKRVR